jgi:hypothetical protein
MPVSLLNMCVHFEKLDPEKSQIVGKREGKHLDIPEKSHRRRKVTKKRKGEESDDAENN